MPSIRTYQTTHPWLTFSLELDKVPRSLWLVLGEAQSRCEQLAGVPLQPAAARHLERILVAKGALATTAMEGNTLTEDEVLRRLDDDLHLPPGREHLAQEIDNIVDVCRDILARLNQGESGQCSVYAIADLNWSVLRGLPLREGVLPGQVRTYEISSRGFQGTPAKDGPGLLQRLCEWLNGPDFVAPAGFEIAYGLLKGIVAHLYLAWMQPFGDGNGRTARLVEYQNLVAAGVPSPIAHLLACHYNQTGHEYYRQFGLATESPLGIYSFIAYAVQGFIDGLRAQLDAIKSQQWEVAWREYVYESLGEQNDPEVRRRRRNLLLEICAAEKPVRPSQLKTLSGRTAAAYSKMSYKTLQRDIDALEDEGLIVKENRGFTANRSLMLAFLPARKTAG